MKCIIKHFVVFVTFIFFLGCNTKNLQLTKVEGKEILITDSIKAVDSIESMVRPFREHINKELDEPLAYCVKTLSKTDGEFNTALGNMIADNAFHKTNSIFNRRTGKTIDIMLLNHGGMRSIISEGTVTARTAYEVMPFENYAVVVELTPEKIFQLADYLAKGKRAHPVSGLQLTLNFDGTIKEFLVQGKPVENNRTYFVGTSNYLANMGDNAVFFENPVSITETDYLLRNMLIDYFKEVDTIAPVADNRFIKLKP